MEGKRCAVLVYHMSKRYNAHLISECTKSWSLTLRLFTFAIIAAAEYNTVNACREMDNVDGGPVIEKALTEAAKERSKDIYDDALKDAVKEVGKSLKTVLGTLNVLLSPLEELREGSKYKHQHLMEEMKERVTDIPEDKLKALPLYISGPVIEGLRYSMDVPELRGMYMGLLSSAMNADKAQCVLPSYAAAIKQLSPDEARILKALPERGRFEPLADVDITERGKNGSINHARNLSTIARRAQCACPRNASLYIENLCRLGLCSVKRCALPDEDYEEVYESQEYKGVIKDVPDKFEAQAVKKCFGLTEYGSVLRQVCWGTEQGVSEE